MKVVEPTLHHEAVLVTFAKNQPPYFSLPASVDTDGTVMTEWEPSIEELALLNAGARIRLWLLHTGVTQGRKLTPIALEVTTPSLEEVRPPHGSPTNVGDTGATVAEGAPQDRTTHGDGA